MKHKLKWVIVGALSVPFFWHAIRDHISLHVLIDKYTIEYNEKNKSQSPKENRDAK